MNNSNKDFRSFLNTKNPRIYFLVAFIFSFSIASKSNSFFLDFIIELCIFGLVALLISFIDFKNQSKKIAKGDCVFLLGHELYKTDFPKLFKLAKENQLQLEQHIRDYADANCGGNIKLAIDILEQEM